MQSQTVIGTCELNLTLSFLDLELNWKIKVNCHFYFGLDFCSGIGFDRIKAARTFVVATATISQKIAGGISISNEIHLEVFSWDVELLLDIFLSQFNMRTLGMIDF